ncbi:MAG: hypothetical protein HKP30_14640 [Myxococcales bacterium]|nr:hypothetical protein [Myxococcales bacterium]
MPILLGLLLLLLVPILRARYDVRRVETCARPEALRDLRAVPGTVISSERLERLDADVPHWTLADLRTVNGVKLRGLLARSYRPIDLYTRPPSALLGKFEAGERLVEELEVDGERLPIQTIYDSSNGKNAMATYLFVYDGKPVEHPALAQLATAPSQIWNGTRPLTLLMVAGPVIPPRRPEARTRATDWLVSAYRHHQKACSP